MSQNNIGEFIQQSRKARGFTQKDLGDRIGVSDKSKPGGKTFSIVHLQLSWNLKKYD